MGDLDDAIREHLELKRRRGADPAEVAREEQEALAPVTRGHPIVVPDDLEAAPPAPDEHPRNGDASHEADHGEHHERSEEPPGRENLGDETQEFRVVLGNADDWLEDDES
jgi:hypothetical protein